MVWPCVQDGGGLADVDAASSLAANVALFSSRVWSDTLLQLYMLVSFPHRSSVVVSGVDKRSAAIHPASGTQLDKLLTPNSDKTSQTILSSLERRILNESEYSGSTERSARNG